MQSKLVDHSIKTAEAVKLLFKKKHTEAALILLYAWIDRMAWLSVSGSESNSEDFKNWIDDYLLNEYTLPCTANDLWAARCALLHTGTPDARDTIKGDAKKILYFGGDSHELVSNSEDTILLKVKDLHVTLIGAIKNFSNHLDKDQPALETVNRKLDQIINRTEDV